MIIFVEILFWHIVIVLVMVWINEPQLVQIRIQKAL
jgi:hypothetical protein